jgi:threonine aldolase
MEINLMSDTVTKPTPAMLEYMMKAEVGDDVFGEDPTVNQLQKQLADWFGHEAGLFCPSGTMTNQIAIHMHTGSLSELICERSSHVYQYETGGYAFNSRVAVNLIEGSEGKLHAGQIKGAIKPVHDWLPKSELVVIENSCNASGGNYYTLKEAASISNVCKQSGLKLHLDGARIFNVLVETGDAPEDWGVLFDSVSICLSKGLGAPVGSVLLGGREFIQQARRMRKVLGGGMRQAGILGAAGLFALSNHVERLKEDHLRAKKIASWLQETSCVEQVRPVYTNIIVFDLKAPVTSLLFLEDLQKRGVRAVPIGPNTVRFVTHLDITDEMLDRLEGILRELDL